MNCFNDEKKTRSYYKLHGFKLYSLIIVVLALFIVPAHISFAQNFELSNQSEEFTGNTTLSNIMITIPADYQQIEPGEELLTSIKIMNLGGSSRMDVIINFEIKDIENKIISTKKETVAIETQANIVRMFHIPESAENGKYFIQATLTYVNGKQVTSEASFEIKKENKIAIKSVLYMIVGLIVMGILVLFLLRSKRLMENYRLKRQVHSIVKKRLSKK
ncbi:MAG: hypothetical protein ACP5N2_06270 [Candidatus Nanoarchaeia archaeon]